MGQISADSDKDADEAINRALRAEQQARQAVERCEREAAEILDQARHEARRIGERTDQRISRLHRSCSEALNRRVAAMLEHAPPSESPEQTSEREKEILEAAVWRLAERLTCPSRNGGGEG